MMNKKRGRFIAILICMIIVPMCVSTSAEDLTEDHILTIAKQMAQQMIKEKPRFNLVIEYIRFPDTNIITEIDEGMATEPKADRKVLQKLFGRGDIIFRQIIGVQISDTISESIEFGNDKIDIEIEFGNQTPNTVGTNISFRRTTHIDKTGKQPPATLSTNTSVALKIGEKTLLGGFGTYNTRSVEPFPWPAEAIFFELQKIR
ncbi:hypothetical protein HY522_10920 [bacterium]|nr:hypothetical protein [bacterium]